MNEYYFTKLYEDYGTHRQSSFCFYKINPSSGNLKWINNGCKPNSWGYRKSNMAAWLFLTAGLASHSGEKMVKICFLQSPVIKAPTLLDKPCKHYSFHDFLSDILLASNLFSDIKRLFSSSY